MLAATSSSRAVPGSDDQATTTPLVRDVLADLLRELQARQLVPAGDAELRRIACQAILDAFSTGGSVVAREGGGAAPLAAAPPLLRRVENAGSRCGYLQIGDVEAALKHEVEEARQRFAVSPDGGVIVDLRGSGGNDIAAAAECAAAMGAWGHPIVVIVDGRTRAAAEVLAARLREGHNAVVLGEPTRGVPYPLRAVRLSGGVEVMLPEIPAGAHLEPLRPDVPGSASTSAPSPRREEDRGGPLSTEEWRDDKVRRALDLLTAICAFRQRHF